MNTDQRLTSDTMRDEFSAVRLAHVSFNGQKTLQYKVHNITITPSILARSAVMDCTDDESCLSKQGVQNCENTYVDRQVRQSIMALGLRYMIGWTFYGPSPSTDYINVYK